MTPTAHTAGPHTERDLVLLLGADLLLLASTCTFYAISAPYPNTAASATFLSLQVCSLCGILSTLCFVSRHLWRAELHCMVAMQLGFVFWYLLHSFQTGLTHEFLLPDVHGNLLADVSSAELLSALIVVYAAKAAFEVLYLLLSAVPLGPSCVPATRAPRTAKPVPAWATVALLLLGLTPLLASPKSIGEALLAGRSQYGLFDEYLNTGGVETFTLVHFLNTAALLSMMLLCSGARGARKVVLLAVAVTASGVELLLTGTRTMLILLVMPPISYLLLTSAPSRRKRILAGAFLAGAVVVVCAELMVAYRLVGLGGDEGSRNYVLGRTTLIDANFYSELVFTRRCVPSRLGFSYESPVLQLWRGLVPKAVWPNRPEMVTQKRIMSMRTDGYSDWGVGNVAAGALGEYWQVAGWFGICVVALWAAAATRLTDVTLGWRTTSWQVRFLGVILIWTLFISFRTVVTSLFIPFLSCALVWLASQLRFSSTCRTAVLPQEAALGTCQTG